MKKIILVLLLILFGCSNEQVSNTVTYIEPVKEGNLFDFLNADTKSLLKDANNGLDVENTTLKNLGKDLPDYNLDTIDGDVVKLSDYKNSKLVIEVVSIYCSHCKEQVLNNNPYIVSNHSDVTFITYFVNGDIDSISAFYKEIGVEHNNPNELITIKNEKLNDYMSQNYSFNATPTYFFFNKGKMTWCNVGTIDKEDFESLYEFAFNTKFDINLLTTEDGKSIFDYLRTVDDVKNDIDEDKYNKLVSLDNDEKTTYLTLKHIGQTFDFNNQYNDESNFRSEIDFNVDYTKDKIAFVMMSAYDEELINTINSFYETNKDIKVFVINTSDKDNEKIADELKAPLASIMNKIPKFLDSGELGNYPSVLFVQDSIITGIYSNFDTIDNLNSAKELFLGTDSIAIAK